MGTIDVTGKNIVGTLANMKKGGKSDKEIDRKEEAQAILHFARNIIKNKTFDACNKKMQFSILADAIESLKLLNPKGVPQIINKLNAMVNVLHDYSNKDYGDNKSFEGVLNEAIDIII